VIPAGEPQTACVDEEAALDFVRGRLTESDVKRIDQHADSCESCRLSLAEAARSFRERWTNAPSVPSAPLTRFVPGDKLSGRYRIVRFIARGGMGEVYEAYDLILNTRLALKTLAATISDDAHAIRRLKQEVNLARLITHPNVCRIFDLGVHEQSGERATPGVLFITMELVPGISLGERLRTSGRMSGASVLPIARAIVAAMGAAHRADIVHRDLKSDNVMLAPDEHGGERVVVMDFGLARAASLAPELHSTDGPVMAGTLAYMAPEQLEGRPVSAVTDIYALGVVMYEMLTGALPFKGEPALATAWKRVTQPAPSVRDLVPDVDPRLQRIVAACLEREPERRPPSVQDVDRQLRALDTAYPALGTAPPARARAPFVRRARVAIAGAALVLGAGAVSLVVRSIHSSVAAGAEHAAAPLPTGAVGAKPTAPSTAIAPPVSTTPPVSIAPEHGPTAPVVGRPAARHKLGIHAPVTAVGSPTPGAATSETPPAPEAALQPAPPAPPPRSADPDEGFIFPKK
jgi:tRNA A-37 threonylcarbamoyl transferase component Bud32